ncbi:HNH endonuclease [mine drainage metagenome]|uniref:HNH endonuclease n=1 Tax=mine drainage metagenome TaxID=410659 RepID=A0A1J5R183_9ZZZZ
MNDSFKFDLTAKRTRLSDKDLVLALQAAAEAFGTSYFTSTQYDSLSGKRPHSATVINRFGSWKKALELIGISGGRERQHSSEQLILNLEAVWKELGFPPGKRQIATLGAKISESPYKRYWGSVRSACEALAAFHNGSISREQLLAGNITESSRTTIPLKDRWAVLKRDNYRCAKCGASPSNNHQVELEVDHIHPVAKGGGNALENLQTLCRECNQGKKDR